MTDLIDSIPQTHRETARAALSAAFGTAPLEGLRPMLGGGSGALAFRIDVGGRRHVLRIEGTRIARRNTNQYQCMEIAAAAGIAPPVRYADAQAGVAIIDFLPQRPLRDYPGGRESLLRDLGRLTARLQSTTPFPHAGDYPVVLGRMLGRLRSAVFAPGLLDPHAEGFARIEAAYRWDGATLVSSHNDPNAGNILFDGERLWLIDWETAFRNDPLADIAILSENFAATPALEDALLEAWRGSVPDPALRARLALMKQMTRLYYVCLIFSGAGAVPGASRISDLGAPSRAQFWADAAAGKLKASDPGTVQTLGKIYLAAFLDGMTAPGFDDMLTIAGRN